MKKYLVADSGQAREYWIPNQVWNDREKGKEEKNEKQ